MPAKKKMNDAGLLVLENPNESHKVTAEQVEAALYECGGIVSWTGRKLGISNTSVHHWLRKHPELQVAKERAKEIFKDVAEKTLYEAAEAGSIEASKFILDRIGRDRGWGQEFNLNIKMKSMNLNLDLLGVEELENVIRTLSKARIEDEEYSPEQSNIIDV